MTNPKNKVEIIYVLRSIPNACRESIIVAEVEGELQIFIDKKLFFSKKNILLLELVIALHKWSKKVNKNIISDFYYESMDYEQHPILKFAKN